MMKEEDKRAKMVEAQQMKSDSLLDKIGLIAHAKAVEPSDRHSSLRPTTWNRTGSRADGSHRH